MGTIILWVSLGFACSVLGIIGSWMLQSFKPIKEQIQDKTYNDLLEAILLIMIGGSLFPLGIVVGSIVFFIAICNRIGETPTAKSFEGWLDEKPFKKSARTNISDAVE